MLFTHESGEEKLRNVDGKYRVGCVLNKSRRLDKFGTIYAKLINSIHVNLNPSKFNPIEKVIHI